MDENTLLNDFTEIRECVYKDERYSVRDNGAIMRHARNGKRRRANDGKWTFGKPNEQTGYMDFGTERVHRIVAFAFLGEPPTPQHVVDHIDTNRRNNRPSNLRWLTKLENVLNNPITRWRICNKCGSIEAFLANPSLLHDSEADPNFKWMRTVSKEEAEICKRNLERWAKEDHTEYKGQGLGEWIFQNKPMQAENMAFSEPQKFFAPGDNWSSSHIKQETEKEEEQQLSQEELFAQNTTASLTSNAKQYDWHTPTEFPLCPKSLSLEEYFSNIKEGLVFSKNTRKTGIVVGKEWIKEGKLFAVIAKDENAFNKWMPSAVFIKDGYFVHTNEGAYYLESIAQKIIRKNIKGEEVEFTEDEDAFL